MTVLTVFLPLACYCQLQIGVAAAALKMATPPQAPKAVQWKQINEDDTRILYKTDFESSFDSPFPVNNRVPLWLSVPKSVQHPETVLILHYLGATDLRAEESLAYQLNKRGLAAAYLALPYHLQRTPPGYKSGQLAIVPNISSLQSYAIQSIEDVRASVDLLAQRPDISIHQLGIAGVSLGSLISELSYATNPRFQHSAFILGGANIADILWQSAAVIPVRNQLKRKGYTKKTLAFWLWPIDPSTWLKVRNRGTAPTESFIISAKFDQIMPPIGTKSLEALLPNHVKLTLDTGHYGGFFAEARIDEEVAKYFSEVDKGEAYLPPRSVSVPTVRLVAQAFSGIGFDIGIGVDLYRTNEVNPFFSSFVLTPRGVDLFVGKELGGGFSVGGAVGNRGAGIGIFWSAIL